MITRTLSLPLTIQWMILVSASKGNTWSLRRLIHFCCIYLILFYFAMDDTSKSVRASKGNACNLTRLMHFKSFLMSSSLCSRSFRQSHWRHGQRGNTYAARSSKSWYVVITTDEHGIWVANFSQRTSCDPSKFLLTNLCLCLMIQCIRSDWSMNHECMIVQDDEDTWQWHQFINTFK